MGFFAWRWKRVSYPRDAVIATARWSSGSGGGAHVGKSDEKRERGLGALVFVGAIGVESVAAAARLWIVDGLLERVLAQKPGESAARLAPPSRGPGQPLRVETRGDHGACLDGLLIEGGLGLPPH